MHSIAHRLLETDRASPADLAVAVVALCEAVNQGLELLPSAPLLMWNAIEKSPDATWASSVAAALGEVADAALAKTIIEVVLDETASELLREAGLDVLSGAAASLHVAGEDFVRIADIVRSPRLLRAAVNLIDSVSLHQNPPILSRIVSIWWERNDLHARCAALDLHRLLPHEEGQQLVLRGLLDSDRRVRTYAVLHIEEAFGAGQARDLVEVLLVAEPHELPRTELLRLRCELGEARS